MSEVLWGPSQIEAQDLNKTQDLLIESSCRTDAKSWINKEKSNLYLNHVEEKQKCQRNARQDTHELTKEMWNENWNIKNLTPPILEKQWPHIKSVLDKGGVEAQVLLQNLEDMQWQFDKNMLTIDLISKMFQQENSDIWDTLKVNRENHGKIQEYLWTWRISQEQANKLKWMLPQEAQKVLETY